MRIHPALSDLFFNHEHSHRSEAYRKAAAADRNLTGLSWDEQRPPSLRDAEEFLNLLASLDVPAAAGVTPAELVDDFLARI